MSSFIDEQTIADYTAAGWWGEETVSALIRTHAARQPDALAYISPGARTTWAQYDRFAENLAGELVSLGLEPGERIGLLLPDTVHVHAALVACSRAGLIAVGIGARAGDAEVAHLLARTSARILVTLDEHRGRSTSEIVEEVRRRGIDLQLHVVLGEDGIAEARGRAGEPSRVATSAIDLDTLRARALGPNDLSMLNSTSGTTGLPKCVTQFENRWLHFAQIAIEGGDLKATDVFMGAVPAPFGFGLWTSHFVGTVLGAPTVVMPRFTAATMIELIERERVSVLSCVSTQFKMLLNSPESHAADLSSLRVMFTGGERIPYDRAAEFEDRTGATVLQFFGSNETGALSYTTLKDPRDKRLTTAGRIIDHMAVKLLNEDHSTVADPGAGGMPAGKGPLTCRGYYEDDAANEQLLTEDGWMLMGDLVTIDAEGYVTVVGRTSDLIIRGGKNISAAEVEDEVETHPAVAMVAVVPVPDELFGEKVCAVATLRDGAELTLEDLLKHLEDRAFSKELFPEYLVVLDELPRSSGAKVAKADVLELAKAALDRGEVR